MNRNVDDNFFGNVQLMLVEKRRESNVTPKSQISKIHWSTISSMVQSFKIGERDLVKE